MVVPTTWFRSAAARMASQSSREAARGFSTAMFSPKSQQATASLAWMGWGVQMDTACTPVSATMVLRSVKARTPYWAAKASARSRFVSRQATNSL